MFDNSFKNVRATRIRFALLVLAILGTGASSATAAADRLAGARRYTCPAAGYVNCRPPTSLRVGGCHRDYLLWARQHCPRFYKIF